MSFYYYSIKEQIENNNASKMRRCLYKDLNEINGKHFLRYSPANAFENSLHLHRYEH